MVISISLFLVQAKSQLLSSGGIQTTSNSLTIHGGVYIGKGVANNASSSAFGMSALQGTAHGNHNSAFGYQSLKDLTTVGTTTSTENSAFGSNTLISIKAGNNNSAFGSHALCYSNGSSNSAFGSNSQYHSLVSSNSGEGNSSFGARSLWKIGTSNTKSDNNVAFGRESLNSLSSSGVAGSYNTAIGSFALSALTSGNNNVGIGSSSTSISAVNVPNSTGSNQLSIQNTIYGINMSQSTSRIGIGTNAPTEKLHILCSTAGNQGVRFEDLPSGTGDILVIDGSGNVYRQASARQSSSTQKELDELKREVKLLKEQLAVLLKVKIQSEELNFSESKLFQNTPNPFNSVTKIAYSLVAENNNYITIASLEGKSIKTIKLSGKGNGVVELSAGSLKYGTYTYSLYADGILVDTKLMVISK